jgi:hypothetical protein
VVELDQELELRAGDGSGGCADFGSGAAEQQGGIVARTAASPHESGDSENRETTLTTQPRGGD